MRRVSENVVHAQYGSSASTVVRPAAHRKVNAYQQDMLEVIRRIAERGKALAEGRGETAYVDLFVHLLDEIARLKNSV